MCPLAGKEEGVFLQRAVGVVSQRPPAPSFVASPLIRFPTSSLCFCCFTSSTPWLVRSSLRVKTAVQSPASPWDTALENADVLAFLVLVTEQLVGVWPEQEALGLGKRSLPLPICAEQLAHVQCFHHSPAETWLKLIPWQVLQTLLAKITLQTPVYKSLHLVTAKKSRWLLQLYTDHF